nr:MAG TPA: hypothetical protein [Bacteriophage sp.]
MPLFFIPPISMLFKNTIFRGNYMQLYTIFRGNYIYAFI